MNALILAAGFGTRLESTLDRYQGQYKEQLTQWVKDKPKGLVPIKGKPIAAHQLYQLRQAGVELNNIYVQTNQRYYHQFLEWALQQGIPDKNIFNNGVVRNEERKEQTQDLLLAIAKIGSDQPLFLFASDTLVYTKGTKIFKLIISAFVYIKERNLFGNFNPLVYNSSQLLDLSPMVETYRKEGLSSVVAYYKERDAQNHGVITMDEHNQLTSFKEKPQNVTSGLVNASVYLFSPEKLRQMQQFSAELLKCKNPLQLVNDRFKVIQASSRLDLGTIDDVIKVWESVSP